MPASQTTEDGRSQDRYVFGLILVLLATLFWSMGGLFTRLVSVDAWTILYWRGTFGALGLALGLLLQNPGKAIDDFEALGVVGWLWALVSALGMVCFVTSVMLTSVAHNAIIWAAMPLATVFIELVVFGRRPSLLTIVAGLAALGGITLMVGFTPGEGDLLGDVIACGMTLSGATMIIMSRRYPGIPMRNASLIAALLSAVMSLPFATPASASATDLMWLAVFGTTQGAIGMALFAIGARHIPASNTALIGTLDGPLAPFWIWLVLAQVPHVYTILGGSIVILAVVIHILIDSRAQSQPSRTRTHREPTDRISRPGRVPARPRDGALSPGAGNPRPAGARSRT